MRNVSARSGLPAAPPALVNSAWCTTCEDDLCYFGYPFSCYLCRRCGAYWPLQCALTGEPGFFDDSAELPGDCGSAPDEVVVVHLPHSGNRGAQHGRHR